MAKIKVSELFYSIQGEGRFMGAPSVFLRTFGCNFTCGGFGMPRGQLSEEREPIALIHASQPYKNYKDLPLVSTGCDSYASWDVRFKDLSPVVETDGIVQQIIELLPEKKWRDEHLVITGGEPLLGWQRAYPALLGHPLMDKLKYLTFETNGTQPLTEEFRKFLYKWNSKDRATFSISAKLSASGEKWEDAIKPEIVQMYQWFGHAYLKFVVDDIQDIDEIQRAVAAYRYVGFHGDIYLMPVGGVESVYNQHKQKVAELAMKLGYRYSDRLQVPLFKNAWGT